MSEQADHQRAATGWWRDRTHYFPMRVYYADTDAVGVVYHSRYLDFVERARTEMFRLIENDPDWRPGGDGLSMVVRVGEIDYKRSAKLDDGLMVRSRLLAIGGASFQVGQDVHRGDDLLVGIRLTMVCVRDGGIVTRIPATMRDKMTNYLTR